MRYVDRPFAAAVALFLLGSLAGAVFILMLPSIRGPVMNILQARLVMPIKTVSQFGNGALLLIVFLNNSIPAALSFAYPFILAKVNWTPPLTSEKRRLLLSCFSWLCAFLVGFFGLGVALSIGWLLGGEPLLFTLLTGAWIHGPIELAAVLLCVSEPLRLAEQRNQDDLGNLRKDLRLLLICLLALVVSSAIEVLARV